MNNQISSILINLHFSNLGRIRKMLRNFGHFNGKNLCRKNCFEKTNDEAQPEGQDVPGNNDSSSTEPQECSWISQLL